MFETTILVVIWVFCGAVLGFWIGRFSVRFYIPGPKTESGIWQCIKGVGSPVSGVVTDCSDEKWTQIRISCDTEKLYAPADGKVIRIFPLGNEILLRTDDDIVLRVRVGDVEDDLQSEYFRVKVLQNEVVSKGKLLLEYDRKALEATGEMADVWVRIEEASFDEQVMKVADGMVKAGEEVFKIGRKQAHA